MNAASGQSSGGQSSTAPAPINTNTDTSTSVPSLPTPDVGDTSFADALLGDAALKSDVLVERVTTVKNLANENQQLEHQLQELQKRLDAAEQKRLALEAKRQQTSGVVPSAL
ncbi:hypothetical protein FRB94_004545 [Tulasnella sp. JGI-2019a]|nr:hypothetical protein FRB93_000976 [Tulasnella sp. JGI-2019a]KAG9001725.1 hypothetical protein FRB94_004545 [Tulasnella sp. JGI-2019a]KAG9034382.1 hypothetical protein FRB95_013290 [Tulasnella sp. JGI-2019a]